MGHLVGGHVDGGQRLDVAVAVAVRHAEAAVLPEGVDVVVAVVDAGVRADTVSAQAVAAVHVLEVVPGERGAVVGVGACRLGVLGGAVAPDVGRLGEQRAGAGGAPVEVVRLVVAARGVGQRVRGRGAQRHLAAVLGVAGPVVDGLPLVQLLAGGRVGDDVELVGGAVVLESADHRLVGELRGAAAQPDDLARCLLRLRRLRALGLRRTERLLLGGGRGHVGGETDGLQLGGGRLRRLDDAQGLAGRGLLDHQVAAEDGEPVEGALVAGVRGAVPVLDDITDDELLRGAEPELLGGGRLGGVGLAEERGALGGGELGGERTRVGLRAGGDSAGGGGRGRGGGGGAGLQSDGDHGCCGYQSAGRGGATAGRGSHADSFCEGGYPAALDEPSGTVQAVRRTG
ncbi:hypothetical protein SCYAM73S_02805 [Streptomyces cyaneofuscatus]